MTEMYDIDPLRPTETDADPLGTEWLFMREKEYLNHVARRDARNRRNAMWLMLLCFSGILCLVAAAYVAGGVR